MNLVRRLRGIASISTTWGALWALLGVVTVPLGALFAVASSDRSARCCIAADDEHARDRGAGLHGMIFGANAVVSP